ncbi:SGNH/GDSL hydrolase family protein [Pseudonocardia humida]|uniref:SGNH/GDSL hydrolase family protein n=1 Tax=Pseudonocardia humida TaxID=2800819 RepID=A0ABT0ZX58_9PSEU|nr:SGNH/GDSL hydrolase family protein [Pseudonocardia humida]MCO1655301.1 SGNH/GDSL hydrolase family protein [Pseudonocardia humida]
MPRPTARRTAAAALLLVLTGCSAQPVAGTPYAVGGTPSTDAVTAAPTALAPGPVTVIALGDSLTAGDGDDSGLGFAGRLVETIAARPGREGSSLVDLGQSGWDSTAMVDGQEGSPAPLAQAVDAARAAAPAAVLATVLIGSNDLWYAYSGAENPTPRADEDAVVATYRANLDRTVRELRAAGAVVVVGLPDDQSVRPISVDIARLNEQLPDVTEEEVGKMSALSEELGAVVEEVADTYDVPTVDTNDPFWSDPSRMADDGIHPNADGYAQMATAWAEAVDPLL